VIDYGDRLGNRTVFKRLGYLTETLQIGEHNLIEACLKRISAGTGRLDPARAAVGPSTSRWGLRINTEVGR